MAVTTPNQDWVPAHPVERTVVRTYQDGLWGEHEYSRWPQPLVRNMWHISCIPSPRSPQPEVPPVLWHSLLASRDWNEDPSVGVPGLGFLDAVLRNNLQRGALYATTAYQQSTGPSSRFRSYGDQLCLVIVQCVDRMNRLPSYAPVAVAVGAHIQRVGLELLGLRTYISQVLTRIDSTQDFSTSVLPVLGVFARDGATVQLATRIGLPVWFLQPITRQLKVWKIVAATSAYFLSAKETDPPMRHHPDELGAVANLTSSWVSNMVFAVSGQLCTSRLPPMAQDASAEATQRPLKSRRIELTEIASQGSPVSTLAEAASGETASGAALSPEERHPSRCFAPPAFVTVPEPWEAALRAVSPLAQPRQSVHYFFPPPFLLDSVSDVALHQYLHNAVRIRDFCKLRLLDPAVSGEPLTIAEWRAALWGVYEVKQAPVDGSDRRLKRKIEDKNGVARLFGQGAALNSYSAAAEDNLQGLVVTAEVAATDVRVCRFLMWECHEVNFRCELNALDCALVPRGGMSVMERWGRESFISGVWGKDALIASVIPAPWQDPFLWPSSRNEEWQHAIPHLRRFLAVVSQWPGCSEELRSMRKVEVWGPEEIDFVQREVALLYVSQFSSRFGRLPIPPILYHGL
ncbi:uncharacterized protein BXZ73DRAFT_56620 [Epithele typhae]|uniref:uncharacterized protein n=1 Tax=Epithele typhae TaxID=378194 RepID=UPI0020072644|nr:uncharacterized protein BXZ73DRAFT_56620 [Epithele typhae]KAH9912049.1 hypothetical protein BXZ73DRAFT_56620 [Epithele typhae]